MSKPAGVARHPCSPWPTARRSTRAPSGPDNSQPASCAGRLFSSLGQLLTCSNNCTKGGTPLRA
eukprot:7816787-Alexandrium_andersonii.AAC.1